MQSFVTALTGEIDAASLWAALTPIAGLVGLAVIFSLSVHFIRKVVKGVGRGKASI